MSETLQKLAAGIERTLIAVGAALIFLFLLGVVLDVSSRLVGISIVWLQEVSTLVFIWSCLIGIPVVYRRRSLYRIDVLPAPLPVRLETGLAAFALVVEGLFIWIVLRYGIEFAALGFDRISQPSGLRMIYGFAALPVAGICCAFFLAEKVGLFVEGEEGGPSTEKAP